MSIVFLRIIGSVSNCTMRLSNRGWSEVLQIRVAKNGRLGANKTYILPSFVVLFVVASFGRLLLVEVNVVD